MSMHSASLKWATPRGDQLIGHMARVSNPSATESDDATKLIGFLIRNRHWSPFEMCNMCVEILTTRDVGRQILRHRSFTFQEFSGRYAEYEELCTDVEIRLQDDKNRQNSFETNDMNVIHFGRSAVDDIATKAMTVYKAVRDMGIAKEVARRLLPEGMVPTRMYMNGTVRSWIHYVHERTLPGVQKEHRLVALDIARLLWENFPKVAEASGVAELGGDV